VTPAQRHTCTLFRNQLQTDFDRNKNYAHVWARVKKVAGRAGHELMAAAALLRSMACHNWLRYLTSNTFWQWLSWPEPTASVFFYLFNVYFTTWRIFLEMSGIQSVSSLPGDPAFRQINNHSDVASYRRLCAEFGVDASTDFCFTRSASHGLGIVFIYANN